MMRFACVPWVFLALVAAWATSAEISPKHRRQAQDHAPEAVMIRVVNLYTSCRGEACSFDVRGEVLCVARSATGLKRGDRIRIQYASDFSLTGSQAPRLTEGETYPAFLHEDAGWLTWLTGRSYAPAAMSASFSRLLRAGAGADEPLAPAICEPGK
jgi:hypothetical protein